MQQLSIQDTSSRDTFDSEFTARLQRYLDINQFAIVDKREWEKWNIIKQTVLGKTRY